MLHFPCLRVLPAISTLFILSSASCFASTILPAGYVSLESTPTGPTLATFDLYNQTGAQSSGDATFPIATQSNFSNVSLLVNLMGGSSITETSTQFVSDGNGGWDGLFTLDLSKVAVVNAVVTGVFAQTNLKLYDGTAQQISASFTASVLPSFGNSLQPGDFGIVNAVTASSSSAAPEPGQLGLVGLVLAGAAAWFRRPAKKRSGKI
jgi:hypothetical protein